MANPTARKWYLRHLSHTRSGLQLRRQACCGRIRVEGACRTYSTRPIQLRLQLQRPTFPRTSGVEPIVAHVQVISPTGRRPSYLTGNDNSTTHMTANTCGTGIRRDGHVLLHHGPRCGRLRLVRAVLAGDPDPPVWSGGPGNSLSVP